MDHVSWISVLPSAKETYYGSGIRAMALHARSRDERKKTLERMLKNATLHWRRKRCAWRENQWYDKNTRVVERVGRKRKRACRTVGRSSLKQDRAGAMNECPCRRLLFLKMVEGNIFLEKKKQNHIWHWHRVGVEWMIYQLSASVGALPTVAETLGGKASWLGQNIKNDLLARNWRQETQRLEDDAQRMRCDAMSTYSKTGARNDHNWDDPLLFTSLIINRFE